MEVGSGLMDYHCGEKMNENWGGSSVEILIKKRKINMTFHYSRFSWKSTKFFLFSIKPFHSLFYHPYNCEICWKLFKNWKIWKKFFNIISYLFYGCTKTVLSKWKIFPQQINFSRCLILEFFLQCWKRNNSTLFPKKISIFTTLNLSTQSVS